MKPNPTPIPGARLLLARSTRGFTLVELIVSMAIMTMMGLAFLAQSEATVERQKRQEFYTAVEDVLSAMRTARTGAITSRTFGIEQEAPEGGFGVHLELQDNGRRLVVTEFVDDSDDLGGSGHNGAYDAGNDSQLSQRTITSHWLTEFGEHHPDPGPLDTNKSEITVLFKAPDAEMVITDNEPGRELTSAEIYFQYEGTQRLICLNKVSRFVEAISGDSCS